MDSVYEQLKSKNINISLITHSSQDYRNNVDIKAIAVIILFMILVLFLRGYYKLTNAKSS